MVETPPKGLPPNAKCVFKGVVFDVWQWQQKMFDGSAETFEKIERANTTEVIPVVGRKILAAIQEQPDRPKPYVCLPGGRCDDNEEPLATAKRELLEETGYISDDWELWYEYNPSGKIIWTVYTYIARNCRKTQEPRLDIGERITTKLISFEEFFALSDDPSFRDIELNTELLRMRLDPKKREEFRKLLWP